MKEYLNEELIINDLIIGKRNWRIRHEENFKFNAPHNFEIYDNNSNNIGRAVDRVLCKIKFQEGALKEHGLNGILDKDLISIVLCRLQHFQKSEFATRENAIAITKLEEALMWMNKRNANRVMRKVQGTNEK